MKNAVNTIENNALNAISAQAPRNVIAAIQNASAKIGVNFSYMVQQAAAESSFKPDAKSKSSSAAGLYQFIEKTWLTMVKKHGDKHGLGDVARQIDDNGRVSNRAERKKILALRNDPEIASAMAAELARENEEFLNAQWGGDVGSTELYLAHFLGAGQAASFLRSRDENPLQAASFLFPDAARANYNVFYDTKTGRAKSIDEVYAFFDKKFQIDDFEPTPLHPEQIPAESIAQESASSETLVSSVFKPAGNNTEKIREATSFERSYAPIPYQSLIASPIELMLLAQMEGPFGYRSRLF